MRKFIFLILLCAGILVTGGNAMAAASKDAPLTARQRAIIPVAAFTANGDTENLAKALNNGLDKGLAINDIKEILAQMYAYAGFPRSLTAFSTFIKVLDEREKKGIKDELGKEPKQLPPDADRLKIGAKIQTELVGRPVKGPVYEFAPVMDQLLKEHLFCDIFYRDVLTNQERELATVAALAALPAEIQLASHLKVALNTGLTPGELRDYVIVMTEEVGKPQGELAGSTLDKVLEAKK